MDGLHVLGPLEVVVEGVSRPLGGRRRRRLLAVLALWANDIVANDRLVDLVWDTDAEGGVMRSLRTEISRVRQSLDGLATVVAAGSGYRLEIDPDQLDMTRFEALVAQATSRDEAEVVEVLGEALGLWREHPFVEITDTMEAAAAESQRLQGLWMSAVVRRAEAQLVVAGADTSALSEVVGQLRGLVEKHPLQERLWALLMLSLYRSGRQAEALAAYQQTRGVLVEDLGLEPSEELVRLEKQILEHDPALDAAARESTPTVRDVRVDETAGHPPSGTVTFLFTDIVGSTWLWERHPVEMRRALERHDEIVRSAIEAHGGYVFSVAGDAFAAAFARVDAAIEAASAVQLALGTEVWAEPVALQVRIGLHTGEAVERGGDYFGPTVNRAARLMSAGHGGQVLLSGTTAALAGTARLLELGEHRLKDLLAPEQIFQLGDDVHHPLLRTLDVRHNNLPVQRTELIGRSEDIAAVVELVGEWRLVTLTGSGGMGKTRLALAAGAEVVDEFVDGVFFVDIAPLADGSLIAEAALRAIGLSTEALARGAGEAVEIAGTMIGRRDVLLVLDNCEHVIDDAAALTESILDGGSSARVLATSREALDVDGEHGFRVPTLGVGVGGPAAELFVQRAASIGVDAARDDPAVVSICERLDGLPLAIELAAAQVAVMPPSELESRLDERFELLVAGRGRRRHRQQHNLRSVLDSSWELLTDDEQAVLAQLSVFAGDWSLTGAEAVCSVTKPLPSILRGLLTKSLIDNVRDIGTSRFKMLETVRLYAAGRLAESGDTNRSRDRHLAWLLGWVSGRDVGQFVCDQQWRDDYLVELDNVRIGIEWALDTDRPDDAADLVLAGYLAWWEGAATREVETWTRRALEDSTEPSAGLLHLRSLVAFLTGQHQQMAPFATEAILRAELTGERQVMSRAQALVAFVTAAIDPDRARDVFSQARDNAHQADDLHLEGLALAWSGVVHVISDEPDLALTVCDQADIVDPDPRSIVRHHAHWIRGFAHLTAGRIHDASTAFEAAARSDHRREGAGVFAATYRLLPAFVAAQENDYEAMQDLLDQAFEATERGAGTVDFIPNVALPAAELLEQVDTNAARTLTTALHRQTYTSPLHYHRYRQLRERLRPKSQLAVKLTQEELHGLATELLRSTFP